MRALVTGHQGYIGGNFVKKWEERGHQWLGYDMRDNHEFDLSERVKELYLNHANKPIDVVVHSPSSEHFQTTGHFFFDA